VSKIIVVFMLKKKKESETQSQYHFKTIHMMRILALWVSVDLLPFSLNIKLTNTSRCVSHGKYSCIYSRTRKSLNRFNLWLYMRNLWNTELDTTGCFLSIHISLKCWFARSCISVTVCGLLGSVALHHQIIADISRL